MVKFPKDLRKLVDTLYTQTVGLSMGCSLGPVLANVFMTCIEVKYFNNVTSE